MVEDEPVRKKAGLGHIPLRDPPDIFQIEAVNVRLEW